MRVSVSVDDFLKHLYLLSRDEKVKVTGSLMAKTLHVSNPAITDMARKLSRKGLIKYEKYQSLQLTTTGMAHALKMVRRHRLWETFLYHVLKLDLQSIHQEAEKLEHQTSEVLLERLADFLENPQFDPHGDPIPNTKGELPFVAKTIKLSELAVGEQGVINRLGYKTEENTMFYDKNMLRLGTTIAIKSIENNKTGFEVINGNHQFYVGKTQANQIYVTKQN
jgi:DtxR family transcriptional regulator, Mn-dependent transcriptional regulator